MVAWARSSDFFGIGANPPLSAIAMPLSQQWCSSRRAVSILVWASATLTCAVE